MACDTLNMKSANVTLTNGLASTISTMEHSNTSSSSNNASRTPTSSPYSQTSVTDDEYGFIVYSNTDAAVGHVRPTTTDTIPKQHSSLKLIQEIIINIQPKTTNYADDSAITNTAESHVAGLSLNTTNSSTALAAAFSSQSPTDLIDASSISWQKTCLVVCFTTLIIITILGNTLVIVSVITTRRLRTVTNCFVMSLAIADWMVGIFVMPPSALLYVYGSWKVGWILCDIWISLDILLCTASILSLCAISLDRYLAVTQPLHYKKRRTKQLALLMIFVVWIVAVAITCPPILGWYEPGRRKPGFECRYNQNKGYVVFSAMGSFFIPMAVMLYVYSRICCVLTSRHTSMAQTEASERTINDDIDVEHITSEFDSNQQSPHHKYSVRRASQQQCQAFSQKSMERAESHHTLYELVEISKSSIRTSSTITCKFSACHQFKPVHFSQSQTSISESCLSSSKLRMQHLSYGKRMPIRISSSKRETKAAQTLSMVVGGFIACWLPFFVYYILIPFLPPESVSDLVMRMLTWLGWISSAINPFIYAFYNTDFRIAFWRLTFRKFCKNQNNLTLLKA